MSTAYRVIMTGSQEVPPNSSNAIGLGTVIFDNAALAATYSIRVSGLDFGPVLSSIRFPVPAQTADTSDDVTNFHVHNAPRGTNGPVVFGQISPNHDPDDLRIGRTVGKRPRKVNRRRTSARRRGVPFCHLSSGAPLA